MAAKPKAVKGARGRPDFVLLFVTFLLVGFGLVMIFSASSAVSIPKYGSALYFVKRQAIFNIAGLFLMCIFMNFRYTRLRSLAPLLLIASLAALVAVLMIGDYVNGAKRWINIGSFSLQPTEFIKLSVILYLAAIISRKGEGVRSLKKGLLPILTVIGLLALLILKQPDFGSALILLFISAVIIVAGGGRLRHLLTIALCAAPVAIYLVVFESYRFNRITAFLNPWDDPGETGYQLIQSLYALAHGGVSGAGLGRSIQKLHYLPEAHTDFIFAVIGEELGLIGSIIFLIIYFFLVFRGFAIALRSSDPFGYLLGIGISGMFAIQFLLNVGAVTGSLPITGVPLPLISYGGSSLLVSMAAVGILLGISRENHRESNEIRKQEING